MHPTYPKHAVPYYLAPLWDADLAARKSAEKRREAAKQHGEAKDESRGRVPKELREKLKKAKAAKGLLQALEEQVRKFVKDWEEKTVAVEKEPLPEVDSEDEEIVFVGRNGQMHDMPPSPKLSKYRDRNEIQSNRLVFDSLADDRGANFGYFSSFKSRIRRLTLFQALAGSLPRILLWSSYLVGHRRRSGETRGLCRDQANGDRRKACLSRWRPTASFVGNGIKHIGHLLRSPFFA